MVEKRHALGKGLSALIPDVPEQRAATLEVDIDLLEPNRFQPRGQFDAAGIEDLARSIKANGIIQPIIVRKTPNGFQIIAGERRWRAAQAAGLLKVPVVVKDVSPEDGSRILQMALIENIQRENLNAIEEALAYRRLGDEFDLTQDQIADAVGKDRSTVANLLRLLKLPQDIRDLVAGGALSMGHARALLSIEQEQPLRKAAHEILKKGMSVREAEAFVKRLLAPPAEPKKPKVADVHTREAEHQLHLSLGSPVRIVRRKKGGTIEIDFTNEDELQRLYELMTGK